MSLCLTPPLRAGVSYVMSQKRFSSPQWALVRPVSESFEACLRHDHSTPIDRALALRQHAAYVSALEAMGVLVSWVPSSAGCPDACFIEDTAVIMDSVALVTRPGAFPRRKETPAVTEALRARTSPRTVVVMQEGDGTLDGGDVLRVGNKLWVGRSKRSDHVGVERLRSVAQTQGLQVRELQVSKGLHLKSAVSLVDPETLVVWPGVIDVEPLRASGLRIVEAQEPEGANLLAMGEQLLMSSAAPRTAAKLRDLGFAVKLLAMSELHKADGALTCLSLRGVSAEYWCV